MGSHNLLDKTYLQRRQILADVIEPGTTILSGDSFDDGEALMRTTAEQGFEGVVAKRKKSLYQPGIRSRDWIKVPHRTSHSLHLVEPLLVVDVVHLGRSSQGLLRQPTVAP